MSGSAMHADTRKPSRMRVALIILGALAVVALSLVAAVVFAGHKVMTAYDTNTQALPQSEVFPDAEDRPPAGPDGSQTILLLGSDTRGSFDAEDVEANQSGRSDTMLVVQIPASRDKVYVTSIMRDAWVNIEGFGPSKINAAMAYGGVPLAVKTVEDLIGTRIDHVAVVDFEGFKGMTDALGGISFTNQVPFTTKTLEGTFTFPAERLELNGQEALAFVRERKAFPDGDYQRVKNQQLYLKALAGKLMSRGVLTNPGMLVNVLEAIGPYVAVDEGLDSGYLLGLVMGMTGLEPADIVSFTMPTAGIGTSSDGQSIIELDPERMSVLKQAFQNDDLAGYVESQDLTAY